MVVRNIKKCFFIQIRVFSTSFDKNSSKVDRLNNVKISIIDPIKNDERGIFLKFLKDTSLPTTVDV